jgi:uncharacterized membrane protein YbaN (DUF454 family)
MIVPCCASREKQQGGEYMKKLKKNALVVCGTLSVGLGTIGIFIPLLPTTVFYLLAAYCYAHSSQKFYNWLMTNPWFGEYIRNYREGRGIPLKQKIFSISLLWLTIGYSVWFVVSLWWVRLILLAIAIGVTIHLVVLKTFKPESQQLQVQKESPLPDGID